MRALPRAVLFLLAASVLFIESASAWPHPQEKIPATEPADIERIVKLSVDQLRASVADQSPDCASPESAF